MATGSRIAETLGAQESGYKERRGRLEIRHALKRSGEQLAHNATLAHRSGFLFPSQAGTAWNPSNFRNRHWYPPSTPPTRRS